MKKAPAPTKHATTHFQALCDAAMDLDPQALSALRTITPLEGARLLALADAAIVRETTAAAGRMAEIARLKSAAPLDPIAPIAAAHQEMLFRYIAVRALIFDDSATEDYEPLDLAII